MKTKRKNKFIYFYFKQNKNCLNKNYKIIFSQTQKQFTVFDLAAPTPQHTHSPQDCGHDPAADPDQPPRSGSHNQRSRSHFSMKYF